MGQRLREKDISIYEMDRAIRIINTTLMDDYFVGRGPIGTENWFRKNGIEFTPSNRQSVHAWEYRRYLNEK